MIREDPSGPKRSSDPWLGNTALGYYTATESTILYKLEDCKSQKASESEIFFQGLLLTKKLVTFFSG